MIKLTLVILLFGLIASSLQDEMVMNEKDAYDQELVGEAGIEALEAELEHHKPNNDYPKYTGL